MRIVIVTSVTAVFTVQVAHVVFDVVEKEAMELIVTVNLITVVKMKTVKHDVENVVETVNMAQRVLTAIIA